MLDKKFRQSQILLHYRNIWWNNFFFNAVKVTISFMIVIINTGQNVVDTEEPLYKDTPEMRISPSIRTPCMVPATYA